MNILLAQEIQLLDKKTVTKTGIPSLVLMENAGRSSAEIILQKYPRNTDFIIMAGTGNNGGDGLVIARYLLNMGKQVRVYLAGERNKLSTETKQNLNIFLNCGGEIKSVNEKNNSALKKSMQKDCIIIDALFGTGFKAPVKGLSAKLIEFINSSGHPVVSIDLPSGIEADSGQLEKTCIKADTTVTFGYPKLCHILYPARENCGEIYLVDISLDKKYATAIKRELIQEEELTLPERKHDSHKYNYGHVLIVGGSSGMEGAVVLACKAASSSGAGLVSCMIPQSTNNIIKHHLVEDMSIPIADKNGMFCSKSIPDIIKHMEEGKFCTILCGPGLRTNLDMEILIQKILKINLPLVLDADALNNLANIKNYHHLIHERKQPTILTPHLGEAAKLLNNKAENIKPDMEKYALRLAQSTGAYIVLKSANTLIATPQKQVFYTPTGNPGMAKAGSGDVLGGIISTLIYRLPVIEALKLAVYLHGLAGEMALTCLGAECMQALDLIDHIPHAFNELQKRRIPQLSFIRKI
ncbi:MAG: NAD(P)H-hydrate dehydratase [Candidatus Margulisbacteria bacterium]|nr:NAD(P)H-hydrate dehydratase [Candidatus Margulisiibacteriota bacterium]